MEAYFGTWYVDDAPCVLPHNAILVCHLTLLFLFSSDPFGIVTGSGPDDYDSFANEDPAILGREFEMEDLLAYISDNNIENVVSISSDVHFAAHVSMSPDRAEGNFTNFKPLEEFVIGPIHAGAFGPNYMDTSFGAEYVFGE